MNPKPFPSGGLRWEPLVPKVPSGRILANGTLWTEWAQSNGCNVLPANPTSVAAYLSRCVASGASQSVVKLARSAIAAHHRDVGQPAPTHGEDVKHLVAYLASGSAERNAHCMASTEHHAGVSDRNISHEAGHGPQLELGTAWRSERFKKVWQVGFLGALETRSSACLRHSAGRSLGWGFPRVAEEDPR